MKWVKISNTLEVTKYKIISDIRTFKIKGYETFAELLELNPINHKKLENSEWFIFRKKILNKKVWKKLNSL